MQYENNCKDCIYIESVSKRLDEVEIDVKELQERMWNIERDSVAYKERIDSIFQTLAEIKTAVKDIAEKIEKQDERPAQLFWSVLGGVIIALLLAGLKFLQ